MRLTCLALLALLALPAAAQDKTAELGDLLERMAENGKRRFLWDAVAARRFQDEHVRMTGSGAEADAPYAVGIAVLRTAGLAVVSQEGEGVPTYRVVVAGQAQGDWGKTFQAAEELPQADEFCTLVLKLQYVSVREVRGEVQGLLTDARNVATQDERKLLVLSDYASALRLAANYVKRVDVAPPAAVTWRVRVAALEGTGEGDAELPEEFREAGLEKATGRDHFRLLGDGLASISMGGTRPRGSGSGKLAVRVGGELNVDVTMTVNREGAGPPELEPLELRAPEGFGGQHQHAYLSARVATREGEWVMAGTIPGAGKDAMVVVVVKVEKE